MNTRAFTAHAPSPPRLPSKRLASRSSFAPGLGAIKSNQRLNQRREQQPVSRSVVVFAAKTAYICIDCGWIYDGREPFDSLPASFKCPVCKAPKRRFKSTAQGGANTKAAMDARFAALKGGKSSSAAEKSDPPVALLAGAGAVILALAYFLGNAAVN
eukprot:jgi/Botrbrau1/1740/Bobra.116_2s0080.1